MRQKKVEAKLTHLGQAILLQKQLKSLEREATEKKPDCQKTRLMCKLAQTFFWQHE